MSSSAERNFGASVECGSTTCHGDNLLYDTTKLCGMQGLCFENHGTPRQTMTSDAPRQLSTRRVTAGQCRASASLSVVHV